MIISSGPREPGENGCFRLLHWLSSKEASYMYYTLRRSDEYVTKVHKPVATGAGFLQNSCIWCTILSWWKTPFGTSIICLPRERGVKSRSALILWTDMRTDILPNLFWMKLYSSWTNHIPVPMSVLCLVLKNHLSMCPWSSFSQSIQPLWGNGSSLMSFICPLWALSVAGISLAISEGFSN